MVICVLDIIEAQDLANCGWNYTSEAKYTLSILILCRHQWQHLCFTLIYKQLMEQHKTLHLLSGNNTWDSKTIFVIQI